MDKLGIAKTMLVFEEYYDKGAIPMNVYDDARKLLSEHNDFKEYSISLNEDFEFNFKLSNLYNTISRYKYIKDYLIENKHRNILVVYPFYGHATSIYILPSNNDKREFYFCNSGEGSLFHGIKNGEVSSIILISDIYLEKLINFITLSSEYSKLKNIKEQYIIIFSMILPEWVDYKSLNEHPNIKKTIEYPQQISGDCTFKAIIMPGIIYYNLSINDYLIKYENLRINVINEILTNNYIKFNEYQSNILYEKINNGFKYINNIEKHESMLNLLDTKYKNCEGFNININIREKFSHSSTFKRNEKTLIIDNNVVKSEDPLLQIIKIYNEIKNNYENNKEKIYTTETIKYIIEQLNLMLSNQYNIIYKSLYIIKYYIILICKIIKFNNDNYKKLILKDNLLPTISDIWYKILNIIGHKVINVEIMGLAYIYEFYLLYFYSDECLSLHTRLDNKNMNYLKKYLLSFGDILP